MPAADIHLPDLQYRRSTFRERIPARDSSSCVFPLLPSTIPFPSLSLISLSLARSIAPLANARLCTRSAPMGARLHVNAIQLSIRCTAIEFYSSQWGYLGLEECIKRNGGERNGEIIRSFRMILRNLLNCGWFVITMRKKCKGKFLFLDTKIFNSLGI